MDDQELLEKLEELARGLEIEVRYERLGGRSGGAVVHGQRVAYVDSGQPVRGRVAALAAILADEEHGNVYLPPVLRELLDRYRED